MSKVAETEDDLTEEPSIIGEATPCAIKSHKEALRMFDELKQYCCEKGMVDLVPAIDNVQDRPEKRTTNGGPNSGVLL